MRFATPVLSVLTFAMVLLASPAWAAWELDNAGSTLTFVSIKAGDLGEVHRFDTLSGSISQQGAVEVVVDLASVDTLIPIRDQRMRDILFEVARFPTATLQAAVDAGKLAALLPGQTEAVSVMATLALKSQTLPLTLEVLVARLSETQILVASRQPVIVNAGQAGLVDGVEQLREIAGLPSISKAVPVSFVLVFRQNG